MSRALTVLLTMLALIAAALPAMAGADHASDVNALLPRKPAPARKSLPTIKGTIKEDTRWHLKPETVRAKPQLPSVFFVIPRANPFPEKPRQ